MVEETTRNKDGPETIRYKDDPSRYMRVLEILIKNNQVFTDVFIKSFLQQVAIIASLVIAITSMLIAVVAISVNLLKMTQDYISAGGSINTLLGIITLIPIFVFLTLCLLYIILLVLAVLSYKTKWGRSNIESLFLFPMFDKSMSDLGQLNLAKYEPEKWDIVVDVDRGDKKSIKFVKIQKKDAGAVV